MYAILKYETEKSNFINAWQTADWIDEHGAKFKHIHSTCIDLPIFYL